jgi:hypothetical protein
MLVSFSTFPHRGITHAVCATNLLEKSYILTSEGKGPQEWLLQDFQRLFTPDKQ